MNSLPTVVLVGRTNVGKSTLFNRLLEERKALVSREAGTTRDWKEGRCLWKGKVIRVIDTGGMDGDLQNEIHQGTIRQTKKAIKKADLILFLVDLQHEPLPQDMELATLLRHQSTPVIVVGNKAETMRHRANAHEPEWRMLGLPAPVPISAVKGNGVGDLLEVVYEQLITLQKPPGEQALIEATRIAVIGKPNVGKSTLLNALVGEERFITSTISHTTREPNDVLIEHDGKPYLFIDTAGIRKKEKIRKTGGLEEAGVERTIRAIQKADVVLFILDASEPFGNQERTLAGLLKDTNAGLVFVVNKWDLVEGKTTSTINEYQDYIERSIPFLTWAPQLFISAKTEKRVQTVYEMIETVQHHRLQQIPHETLVAFLQKAIEHRRPIPANRDVKPPKLIDLQQMEGAPPRFMLTVKARRADSLHKMYLNYLENQLRVRFPLEGTPIRLHARAAGAVSS
ncbi:TPA: ribosome biogenesis GTPase Der [Candidatus Uhrbacteria bacterium]|nr:ribosome biogenesis GTPase Der [Candidatus Uhrbacteria bacterium]